MYFAFGLFLVEMGRGYTGLPLEDNRGCPWTWRISPKPFLGDDFWGFVFGSACKMGIPVSQKGNACPAVFEDFRFWGKGACFWGFSQK